MKLLLTTLISALFLCCYSNQLPGTWILDWQNFGDPLSEALPTAFNISADSAGDYAITYSNNIYQSYSDSIQNDFSVVEQASSGPFVLQLTDENSNIVLIDTKNGQKFLYNVTTDTIQAEVLLSSQINNSIAFTALYSRNGSYRSDIAVFGALAGNWTAEYSEQMEFLYRNDISCAPQGIDLMPIMDSAAVKATFYYTTTDCAIIMENTAILKIASPSTGAISFSGYGPFIVFDPDQPDQIQEVFGLTYKKVPTATDNFISGTWQIDWQSNPNLFQGEVSLEVSVVDSYMEAVITANDFNRTSVFTEVDGSYLYVQSSLLLSYDAGTNSLLSDSTGLLFSPNGSLFSSEPFISNWVVDTTSVQGSCCVPEDIKITSGNTTSILNAYYYFPVEVSDDDICASQVQNDPILETTLNILKPSVSQLIWTDAYGSIISFNGPSTTDEITVEGFMNGRCIFNLKASKCFART